MKLIIDIDEEQYKFIKQSMTMDKVKDYHALLYDICEHIANGTPLKSLGEEMRLTQKAITDEKVLIGFNMAVALYNKHLGRKGENE